MKKMFFAVAAAFVMVSVSNVFANSNAQLGNASMAVAPTAPADTVVTPATPEEPATPATPAAPADSTAKPVADSTNVA